MAKLTLEGDVYEIEILAEKCLRRKEDKGDVAGVAGGRPPGNLLRTPEDGGIYGPEAGEPTVHGSFNPAPVMPVPPDICDAAARNAAAYQSLGDQMWPSPPRKPSGRHLGDLERDLLDGRAPRPRGVPSTTLEDFAHFAGLPHFAPERRQSGPGGKRPLTVDDARELFDGLNERLDRMSRRVGVVEATLGLRTPEEGEPDDDDTGDEREEGDRRSEELARAGEMLDPTPPPSVASTRQDEMEKARARKRQAALAAAGDLVGAMLVGDAEGDGLALLRALQDAKDLLGPNAIAVRAGDVFTVQDSPEPAKVIGMGPSWDAALMDAGDKLAKAKYPAESPILPDQDLPYEKALAFARERIGAEVILTFSPADSSRSRVCLSMPVGTPDRKMILAGSFLEALSEYLGHTVDWVRGETQHFTLEERTRRLAEQQRKDCETPGVCCTPPGTEEFRSPTEAAGLDDDEPELKAPTGGLTPEQKRDLDTAV